MAEKQNIVYFLGAGSSYCFGYPLTWEMMADILGKLRAGNLFNSAQTGCRIPTDDPDEKELLEYIELTYPGLIGIDLSSDAKRVPNIIEVFSFVDHLCFYNTPHHPYMTETKLTRFKVLLNRALVELILIYEKETKENVKSHPEKSQLKKKFIASIRQQYNEANVTIITTNYDMVIDDAFQKEANENKIFYGFPYRSIQTGDIIYRPDECRLNYYKLHGSLNWLMCSLCGRYYINWDYSIANLAYTEKTEDYNRCHCNKDMRLSAVLIAPSTVRDIRDSNLLQIWKEAQEAIWKADKLIMVGYSLPAEDLAIKSIILRGLNGNWSKKMRELEIVQYKDEARPNYINAFGEAFNEKHYYNLGLEAYLQSKHPHLFE